MPWHACHTTQGYPYLLTTLPSGYKHGKSVHSYLVCNSHGVSALFPSPSFPLSYSLFDAPTFSRSSLPFTALTLQMIQLPIQGLSPPTHDLDASGITKKDTFAEPFWSQRTLTRVL